MKIIALTILLMIISCGKSEPEDLSWGYQKYGNRCYYTDSNDQCNDYTDQEREALRRQNINFDVHCTSLKKTGKKGGKYIVEVWIATDSGFKQTPYSPATGSALSGKTFLDNVKPWSPPGFVIISLLTIIF